MYAIIDVETTGYSAFGNKITDIAIFIHNGEKVVKTYQSLVNPECNIPHKITQLTGITNGMVKSAPKFHEIAKKVMLLTKDCVFVAHNVNFDYNVIRDEFKSLGADFRRKKLCTVRLSRKLIKGLPSYSLGNLCSSLGISIKGRHRAYGDAEATVELFDLLLSKDVEGIIDESLKPRSKEATLPPLLPRVVFDNLSQNAGVYYFHNKEGKIIYVGKAKCIQDRVLGHFRDKSKKEMDLSRLTANVTYKETGSELVALLFESAEIKRLHPLFNSAQKRKLNKFGVFQYIDGKGILRLSSGNVKAMQNPIMTFYSSVESRKFLEELVNTYDLCPKCCNLQSSMESCFDYSIKNCKGVCCGKEEVIDYNKRVLEAINSVSTIKEDFVLLDDGRRAGEKSFVMVEEGIYRGFGFIENKLGKDITFDDCAKVIEPQNDNGYIQRILRSHISKRGVDGVSLVLKPLPVAL